MDSKKFREATEQRKKGELDEIEDAARNEISRRFGEGDVDSGAAGQQARQGSNSLRSNPSDSQRPDVQIADTNPSATDRNEDRNSAGEKDEAA